MLDISSYLPRRARKSSAGWISFNCPVCHLHGQTPDRRGRGGLKREGDNWVYHCFNCGHTASYTRGKQLGHRARQLLLGLGLDHSDLAAINLDSLRYRTLDSVLEGYAEPIAKAPLPTFKPVTIDAVLVDPANPDHQTHVAYIQQRGFTVSSYPFMLRPEADRPGIIIPFTQNGVTVGYTERFLDDKKPKYMSETQPGYLFGMDLQRPEWAIAIVTEGPLDALSLNGLATMHQLISKEQHAWLASLEREIVVVPDQNMSGIGVIEQALEAGYSVSIPDWGPDVEDVNAAIQKYGRIGTLLTILEHKESNALKIQLRRKWLAARTRT